METVEEIGTTVVTKALEVRIDAFPTATKMVSKRIFHDENLCINFVVYVFPNGHNNETAGWLELSPSAQLIGSYSPTKGNLSCTMSLIDTEGNSRFPVSFGGFPFDGNLKVKYVKRSFILNKADEFLQEGALTLRCDLSFIWRGVEHTLRYKDPYSIHTPKILDLEYFLFFNSIPQTFCSKSSSETGDPSDNFKVYDLTSDIHTLPESPELRRKRESLDFHSSLYKCIPQAFCSESSSGTGDPSDISKGYDFTSDIHTLSKSTELRKSFDVCGISPALSESEENSKSLVKDIWIFDTEPDRFLISIGKREESLGFRLVNASPVIRQCINAPMKEKREKRILFPNVKSETFKHLLYFLIKGELPFRRGYYQDLYKISHLYEIKSLQKLCAEHLACGFRKDFDELKSLAELYSDDYLTKLLYLVENYYRNMKLFNKTFSDDKGRHDSDSYI